MGEQRWHDRAYQITRRVMGYFIATTEGFLEGLVDGYCEGEEAAREARKLRKEKREKEKNATR